MLPTEPPIRLITKTGGYVAVPAPDVQPCPHCGAMNRPGVVYLTRVADERGHHLECSVCSYDGP